MFSSFLVAANENKVINTYQTQITLLEGWKLSDLQSSAAKLAKGATAEKNLPLATPDKKSQKTELKPEDVIIEGKQLTDPKTYGIDPKDMELFGLDSVLELSKANVNLIAERGEMGRLSVALSDSYSIKLDLLEFRDPIVIVKCMLFTKNSEKPLIENTLFLVPGKPSLLGVTNMKQALILLVKIQNRK